MHVTVNARTEDDVDPDDIAQKVAKASGANYSIHQEKPKAPPPKPTKNAKKEDSPGPVVNSLISLNTAYLVLAQMSQVLCLHNYSSLQAYKLAIPYFSLFIVSKLLQI